MKRLIFFCAAALIAVSCSKPCITVKISGLDETELTVEHLALKDYPVPDATAYDEYAGECAVKVSAWYNYESASPVSVPIRDGKIFIGRPGTYALVYSAQDKLGTPGEKICWVTADDSPETLTLELPSDTTAHMGEFFTVPEPLRVSGGSGDKILLRDTEGEGTPRKEISEVFQITRFGVGIANHEIFPCFG